MTDPEIRQIARRLIDTFDAKVLVKVPDHAEVVRAADGRAFVGSVIEVLPQDMEPAEVVNE